MAALEDLVQEGVPERVETCPPAAATSLTELVLPLLAVFFRRLRFSLLPLVCPRVEVVIEFVLEGVQLKILETTSHLPVKDCCDSPQAEGDSSWE